MSQPFFPNLVSGWVFFLCLLVFTGIAAYHDLRRTIVPKWLTVTGLGLGLVVSVVRGAWMGLAGERLWLLETGSGWLGALDGLLFGLSGALAAFVLLFILWTLGTCGGGDVKLFTALGAWLGLKLIIYVFAVSLVVLLVCIVVYVIYRGLTTKNFKGSLKGPNQKAVAAMKDGRKPGKLRVTYSLSIAIATLVVMLWMFRFDLQLAPASPPPTAQKVYTYGH